MTFILAAAPATAERLGSDPDGSVAADAIGPYMGVFFIAYFACFLLTPVMRWLAVRNGIIDWPDLKRKNHIEPIAYLGGVAIFIGWLLAVELSFFFTPVSGLGGRVLFFPLTIIIGAALIVLTGFLDDVYGISPRVKVGGQLLAAAAIASHDVGTIIVADALGLFQLDAPAWFDYGMGTLIIAVVIVGACNSMNLLDGLDGLASGVATIACIGFLFVTVYIGWHFSNQTGTAAHYHHFRMVMCLATIGALLGFLPYNFNPANIFMGDAGSLLIGYLCATIMLLFAHIPGNSLIPITACLIIFGLPITDTALAIFRRKMRGQPILSPDNQHIHHLLRRSGLTVRKAVVTLYGIAALFAAIGCTMVWLQFQWRYMLAVFFVMFGFVVVTAYKIGHRMLLLEQSQEAAASQSILLAGGPSASPRQAAATSTPSPPSDADVLAEAPDVDEPAPAARVGVS